MEIVNPFNPPSVSTLPFDFMSQFLQEYKSQIEYQRLQLEQDLDINFKKKLLSKCLLGWRSISHHPKPSIKPSLSNASKSLLQGHLGIKLRKVLIAWKERTEKSKRRRIRRLRIIKEHEGFVKMMLKMWSLVAKRRRQKRQWNGIKKALKKEERDE